MMKKNLRLKKQAKILLISLLVILIMGVYFLTREKTMELNGKSEITIYLNEEYREEGTNIENCIITSHLDNQKEGTYKIIYEYHDQILERTVHVVDPNRIVMNLNGDNETYIKLNNPYIESGCHVIDRVEGNMSDKVEITGNVDTSKVGDYKIIYTIEYNGLAVKKERVVHVVQDFEENTTGIPVLMYHYVYTKDDVPEKLNVNYILDTDLEKQLKYLTENNYYFPSYKELESYVKGEISLPKKSVILTFDDGQKGFLKYGIPLLEKYKVPATSFVIASKNGEKKVEEYASEYISFQSHSYNMHRGGGNIGHGGIISVMSKDEIINDLKKSQMIVQNSEAFAYPYGDITDTARQAVKETEIICAFTTQYGKVTKGADLAALPRVRVVGDNSLESYIESIE